MSKKLGVKSVAAPSGAGLLGARLVIGQGVGTESGLANGRIKEFRRADDGSILAVIVAEGDTPLAMTNGYEVVLDRLRPPACAAVLAERKAELDARIVDYALQSAEDSLVSDMRTLAGRLRRMAEEAELRVAYVTDARRRCPHCDTILEPGDYREGDGLCGVCGGETRPKFTDAQRREKLVQAVIWVQADVLSGFGNLHLDHLTRDAAKLANAAGRKGEEGGW
jgi:hypothetical protein